MRSHAIFAILIMLLLCGAVRADDAPWIQAGSAVQATTTDIDKGRSLMAIASHTADLEMALADGARSFPPPPGPDGRLILLTDGPTETLAALAAVAAVKKQDAVAHPNPYPIAVLYLALYYNEVHKYDDALRVIEAGLKLSGTDMLLGAHLARIFSERSTAYAGLKRFDEALAVCDAGLTLAVSADLDRARFNRCRGFDLTELGRLDEAEAAYNESLKLEPGNTLAKGELAYIAKLRAGGKAAPPGQVLVPAAPAKDGVTQKPL